MEERFFEGEDYEAPDRSRLREALDTARYLALEVSSSDIYSTDEKKREEEAVLAVFLALDAIERKFDDPNTTVSAKRNFYDVLKQSDSGVYYSVYASQSQSFYKLALLRGENALAETFASVSGHSEEEASEFIEKIRRIIDRAAI